MRVPGSCTRVSPGSVGTWPSSAAAAAPAPRTSRKTLLIQGISITFRIV